MSSYNVAQLARLEPPYLTRYGLTSAPFPPTHEDHFLYLDNERQQRLNMLRHLTEYSSLLLIVSGERGIGKSSLKQRYVAGAEDEWLICQVDAHPMMDSNELLSNIAEGFGLIDVPATPGALQDSLYNYLASLHRKEMIPILLIDDAHELPKDALEAIFHLADVESGDGNLLRTILFCEPEINVMLESPFIQPLRERITHTMEILPFDEEHTAEYLRHRLAVAGLEGASPFSAKDIKRIYKTSQGVPEKINEAAHMLLNGESYEPDEEEEIAEASPSVFKLKRIIIGLVIISVFASLLLFQDEINQLFETPSAPDSLDSLPSAVIETPATTGLPMVGDDATPIDTGAAPKRVEPRLSATEPVKTTGELPELPIPERVEIPTPVTPTAPTELTEKPVAPAEAVVPPKVPAEASSKAPAKPPVPLLISGFEPDPVSASTEPQTISINGSGFSSDNEIRVAWTGKSKTLESQQVEYVSDKQLNITIRVGTKPDTWKVTINDAKHKRTTNAQFNVVAKPPVRKAVTPPLQQAQKVLPDWLTEQNPNHFTLQLLASHQYENIQKFIQTHQLPELNAVFTSMRDGKRWYALVAGSYPDRKTATSASEQLTTSIKGITPWVRSFASIQNVIVDTQAVIKETPKPTTTNLTDQAAWLWSQDPSHYTLQLLGGRSEKGIKSFMAQHNLQDKAVFFRTVRDGKPWFALVYGSYPDRQQALQAIKRLPAKLQKTTPWARSFASIHSDLYRN